MSISANKILFYSCLWITILGGGVPLFTMTPAWLPYVITGAKPFTGHELSTIYCVINISIIIICMTIGIIFNGNMDYFKWEEKNEEKDEGDLIETSNSINNRFEILDLGT